MPLLVLRELQRQRIDDHPDETVLNREDVAEVAVVAIGPKLAASDRVDQLHVDANGFAGSTHAGAMTECG